MQLIGLIILFCLSLLVFVLGLFSTLDGDWVPLAVAMPGFITLAWLGLSRYRSKE